MAAPTVDSVAAIRAQLWDAGFRPVPVLNHDHPDPKQAGKAPLGKNWGDRARQDPPDCLRYPPVLHALNTGILTDGLRAIDIDVDDPEIATRVRSLVVQRFGEAPIRMRRNSPRCLILYRATAGTPAKIVLAGRHGKVEVLGRGQQFVAFGRHPSGADLEWFPDAPGAELLTAIPAISEDDLLDLLDQIAPILGADPVRRLNGQDHAPGDPQADPLRIAAALNVIPNSGPPDWEAWNRVGMAIWRATGGLDIGWQAWNAWSGRHPSYDATETRDRWDHYFDSPPDHIGAGTLFHMAREAGAEPASRPATVDKDAGLPLIYFRDVQPNLDAADFVEGLLIQGSMSVVYGESNCGKTFLMTDLGLHVAMGKPWRGREIEQGAVIYCALEGSHGISNRVAAFRKHYGLENADIPFAVIPCAINMLDSDEDRQRLMDTIVLVAEQMNIPVRLVVIDTLSRALAGGNENAPDDMGSLVTNTDKVRQATGAAVCYVHHSGKDSAKGARGHSLLRAATDTEIEVSREDKDAPSTATVTKQRELEIEGEFVFRLEVVELGLNRRGKPVTSCVVVEADLEDAGQSGGQSLSRSGHSLSPNAGIGLRALKIALGHAAAKLPETADYPHNTWAVSASVWRAEFYQLKSGTPDTQKKSFNRAEEMLLSRNVITVRNGLVWFCKAATGEAV